MNKKLQWGIGLGAAALVAAGLVWYVLSLPSAEERRVVAAINRYTPVVEAGVHARRARLMKTSASKVAWVDDVDGLSAASKKRLRRHFEDSDERGDVPFRATLYNRAGEAVGVVNGYRIEGFSTTFEGCQWFEEDPALAGSPAGAPDPAS